MKPSCRLILIAMLVTSLGCGSEDLVTDYGSVRDRTSESSIHGFGVLRQTLENNGWEIRAEQGVWPREYPHELLVFLPTGHGIIGNNAIRFIHSVFLAGGDRKTALVILGGYDGAPEYWARMRAKAPAPLRMEYRRKEREAIRDYRDQLSVPLVDGRSIWANVQYRNQSNRACTWSGPLAEGLQGTLVIESATALLPADTAPKDPDWKWPEELRSNLDPTALTNNSPAGVAPPATTPPATTPPATTPAPTNPTVADESSIRLNDGNDSWVDEQLQRFEVPSFAEGDFQPLLTSDEGEVLAARLTCGAWGESELILVSSAAFLCNYPVADPQRRRVANNLISLIPRGPGRAIIVDSPNRDMRVFEMSAVDGEKRVGTKLFTIRGIGGLSLGLAVLGIVTLMGLWPIFGRPRTVHRSSLSDFSESLRATGALLATTGDQHYSFYQIINYVRFVRGESLPEHLARRAGEMQAPSPTPSATNQPPFNSSSIT
jgi:hypothetical protein